MLVKPILFKYKRSTIRPSCKRAPKKRDFPEFLWTLYFLKFILPHLSYLSQTFQSGNLNFSRISPNIHVTKTKIQETRAENKLLVELDKDLGEDRRLSLCNITLPESTRSLTENRVKSNVEIISSNTDSSNSTWITSNIRSFFNFRCESDSKWNYTRIQNLWGGRN